MYWGLACAFWQDWILHGQTLCCTVAAGPELSNSLARSLCRTVFYKTSVQVWWELLSRYFQVHVPVVWGFWAFWIIHLLTLVSHQIVARDHVPCHMGLLVADFLWRSQERASKPEANFYILTLEVTPHNFAAVFNKSCLPCPHSNVQPSISKTLCRKHFSLIHHCPSIILK